MAAISYELIFGPFLFGVSHLEKRVRKVKLVVSKEAGATMLISTSASDEGAFSSAIAVGAETELDAKEVTIPLAQGDPAGGLAYRVKVIGAGVVQVHDIIFDASPMRV